MVIFHIKHHFPMVFPCFSHGLLTNRPTNQPTNQRTNATTLAAPSPRARRSPSRAPTSQRPRRWCGCLREVGEQNSNRIVEGYIYIYSYGIYNYGITMEYIIQLTMVYIYIYIYIYPRCSMYGILTYMWLIFGVNGGKWSIHGAYGCMF